MVITIQHFVSQRLGRGVGRVERQTGGQGSVQLDLAESATPILRYRFAREDFENRCPEGSALDDYVLRVAIGQAHRDLRKHDTSPGERPLSTAVLPWLGDLAAAPFGSGTVGFLRRNGFVDERRLGNASLEISVDQALLMRKAEGREAARCYLEQASVPDSIIRRVLSHTAQRRKTRIAPESPNNVVR